MELKKQASSGVFWTSQVIQKFYGVYRPKDVRENRKEADAAYSQFEEERQVSMHEIRRLRKQANDAYRRGDRNAQMIIQS